jgi:hypothetical protein
MVEPTTSDTSASTAAQSGSEHVQGPPSSDESNEAADGSSVLPQAGQNANSVVNMALPGIDLPLDQHSDLPTEGQRGYWYEKALPVTVRERVMLTVMAALKDKPDWERKVFDELIVSRWRAEALTASNTLQTQNQTGDVATAGDESTQQSEAKDPTSHYNAPARQRVVTERLFQCVSLSGVRTSYTS